MTLVEQSARTERASYSFTQTSSPDILTETFGDPVSIPQLQLINLNSHFRWGPTPLYVTELSWSDNNRYRRSVDIASLG
jgi:hypothetical protein